MQIIVDSHMRAQLAGLNGPVSICDDAGNVLGIFAPNPPDYSKIKIPYTEEELDAARKETGGRPLADILRDLEASSLN